ncbi:MAG TPA: ATP-binding cassette domain-containing protein [Actinomycetes bacterium]|jgi:osmoprotectant transport system ATP-binding protein|nr:ATP-binding cassette domain-containing protein [Actinomycetes bacterium]
MPVGTWPHYATTLAPDPLSPNQGLHVITFESVTKQFADGTTAVHALDLECPDGEVTVLVGPSGCGKTTTLRMINRMIEASSGRITVDGQDVQKVDPPQLRRRIGYVIQQVGLFPHRTIAENIATVPGLVGWDKPRTKQRVDQLVDLVGLPAEVVDRYPHQLSGGQRQRVGVARALAVDPPIMLMDEPFGAVDPIVRGRLQDEFLRLQQEVKKTIVFVTHDIDEAIKMGDRIAIFRQGGYLEQFAPPDELLAEPNSDFVADFLGGERNLKRLALIPVSEVHAARGPVVDAGADADDARRAAETFGSDWVVVVDDDGRLRGWAFVRDVAEDGVAGAELRPFRLQVHATDSLRAALNAMVESQTGVAVRVSDGVRYEGLITQELLSEEIR